MRYIYPRLLHSIITPFQDHSNPTKLRYLNITASKISRYLQPLFTFEATLHPQTATMTSTSETGSYTQDDGWGVCLAVIASLLGAAMFVLMFWVYLVELSRDEYADKYASMRRQYDLVTLHQRQREEEAAQLRKKLEELMARSPVPGDGLPSAKGAEIQHNPVAVGDDSNESDQNNRRGTPELPTDMNQSACPDTHTPAHDLAKDDNERPHHLRLPPNMPHQSRDLGDGRPPSYRTLDDELRAAMADEGDESYASEAEARYWGDALASMDFRGPVSPLQLPRSLQGGGVMEAGSIEEGVSKGRV